MHRFIVILSFILLSFNFSSASLAPTKNYIADGRAGFKFIEKVSPLVLRISGGGASGSGTVQMEQF